VRWLKNGYLRQLERVLNHRWVVLGFFLAVIAVTGLYVVPRLGREFMPELEEGNLWIRGTYPLNISLDRVSRDANATRAIIRSYPEGESAVVQLGRPDDGVDPTGFYNLEVFVPLRPERDWPALKERGTRRAGYEAGGGRNYLKRVWLGLLDRGDRLLYGPTR